MPGRCSNIVYLYLPPSSLYLSCSRLSFYLSPRPQGDNISIKMARYTTLYLSALIAGLTAALFGYSVGFIGGIIVLPSFLSHFSLSTLPPSALASTQARIITSWLVGALFGVPLGMPFCSRFGRKGCLFLAGGLYVCGAGMQLLDFGIGGFEVGRALNGLGVGVGTLGGPM